MRKRKFFLILGFALFSLLFSSLWAGQKNYRVLGIEGDFYFGHITYLEPGENGNLPIIRREGAEREEEAVLNMPLMPGDTILSCDGRLEIQFDNGTILRLDKDTDLYLQTVLAPSLSSSKKISNIVLNQGTIYVMYKKYDSSELFQVLTNKSAIKLEHNSVCLIRAVKDGWSEIIVTNGKVWLMGPPEPQQKKPQEFVFEKGWKAFVSSPLGAVQAAEFKGSDEFLSWNQEINANFEAYHEASVLPKPLQTLPPAIFYFAQRYGSIYGEWIWHDRYGYVWRPFYNDYCPWGTWQPFFYGQWITINNSLFWVPEEPWGWVPYHLGFWMWDKNKGWLWIPGSLFAPAWAVWDFFYGYYAWRPWSLYDWYFRTSFYPYGYSYSLGNYYYSFYYQVISEVNTRPILEKIRKDQLKKSSFSEKVPMPKEVKKITDVSLKALQRGDPEAVESLRRTVTSLVMVSKEDLSPRLSREKIIRFNEAIEAGKISLPPSQPLPREKISLPQDILRSSGRVEAPTIREETVVRRALLPEGNERIEREGLRRDSVISPTRLRVVDWNPDVRIASRTGLDIVYDSQRNEVRCPQLGLASRDLAFRRALISSPEGGFRVISNPFGSGSEVGGVSATPAFSGGADRSGASSSAREGGAGRSGEKK